MDILDDKEYIKELRERIADLKGQLFDMQTRAIEAEKANAGAQAGHHIAIEEAGRANERARRAEQHLAALLATEPVVYNDAVMWNECAYCGGNDVHHQQQISHEPDCPWLLAKATLGKKEAAG